VRLASGHTDRQIDRHTHALIAMLHIHTEVGYSLTALSHNVGHIAQHTRQQRNNEKLRAKRIAVSE